MVAVDLGRRFVGIELNPEYAEMATRRIGSATPSLFVDADLVDTPDNAPVVSPSSESRPEKREVAPA